MFIYVSVEFAFLDVLANQCIPLSTCVSDLDKPALPLDEGKVCVFHSLAWLSGRVQVHHGCDHDNVIHIGQPIIIALMLDVHGAQPLSSHALKISGSLPWG